jgi:hypothetical protein
MTKVWLVVMTAGACWLVLSSSGCNGAPRSEDAEDRDIPLLTDLQAPLMPASSRPESTSRGPGWSTPSEASDPRAEAEDPSCQDTCASQRAECGQVCGRECGQCPDDEECRDHRCECAAGGCDGTRCANACGQACACATGTACDATGLCVLQANCSGPFCASGRQLPEVPSLPEAPPEPGQL